MVTGIPILDENNNITKIINISRDITENQNLGLELKEVQSKLQWFQKELNKRQGIDSSDVSYKSPSMRKIMDLILHIADLDATGLLLGETGVGKGYIARVIHESSIRERMNPLFQLIVVPYQKNLLESELFGYESGAFSGANKGGKRTI